MQNVSIISNGGYNISTLWKQTAARLFHYSGGTALIRNRFRGAIRILMYHRFPEGSLFEEQCAHLARNYRPISLSEAAEMIAGRKTIPDRAIVVTVDDGYRDFLEVAFPALERHRIPATVYLTTDLPDRNGWLWVDQLRWWFEHARVREIEVMGERWVLDSADRRARAARMVKEKLKKVPNPVRIEWLDRLPSMLDADAPAEAPEGHRALDWEDVRFLVSKGIEFGAHTRTHPILSRVSSVEELRAEICGSKARIEAETGVPVRHFCYPNGMPADFTEQVVDLVRSGGFETAVVGVEGVNRAGANAFELRRLGVEPYQDLFIFARLAAGYRVLRNRG